MGWLNTKKKKEGKRTKVNRVHTKELETAGIKESLEKLVKEEGRAIRAEVHKVWDGLHQPAAFGTPIQFISHLVFVGQQRSEIEDEMIRVYNDYPESKDVKLKEWREYNFVQDVITDFTKEGSTWIWKGGQHTSRWYLPLAIAFGIAVIERVTLSKYGTNTHNLYLSNESWGPLSRWSCDFERCQIFSDANKLEISCRLKPTLYILYMTPNLTKCGKRRSKAIEQQCY